MTGEAGAARPVGFAVLGLGTAGRNAAKVSRGSPHVRLVSVCDLSSETADAIASDQGVRSCGRIEELCADPEVEAVYVSTPTFLHVPNALQLAEAGKHLMIEKPIARSGDEGRALVKIAEENGVIVMAVNTRGRDAPVRAMARLAAAGAIGRIIHLSNISYTNWVLRPRYSYELLPALGGGVTFRQAPHQVEIARAIIDRPVVAVTALAGSSQVPVPTVGNYSAVLEFEGGASANLVYNGYGYFDTSELTHGIGEGGRPTPPDASLALRQSKAWSLDKYGAGGLAARDRGDVGAGGSGAGRWGFVGLTIVSGERGDLRQSRTGVVVYDEKGSHEVEGDPEDGGLRVDFEEFYRALREQAPNRHDATYGTETIEICEAIWTSSKRRERVALER